jgi:outer membrane protein assembly factor BamB
MTEQQLPLERMVAGWMADEAAGAPQALLEQILETTARTTPRPRLWALAAEPTLRGRTMRAAVGLPNRRLVLAAVLGLLLAAIAGIAVGAYLLLNPKPAETADFPGFRGDAARGAVGLQGPIGNPVLAWRQQAPGAVLEVAVIGERVFFASDDGGLHAATRDRGIEQWTVHVGTPPLVGPFAADGRLYVSDGTGTFHAYRIEDGAELWTSANRYAVPMSRSIEVDGALYFGTSDGFVVALDAATGAERWRVQPPGAIHVDAPAFADGRLFAGTDGAGFVAIDVATHQLAWIGDTDAEDTGSATVAGGIAYIGANAVSSATGTLHAFDAASGRALWTAVDPILGIPTVADGVAYTTGLNGLVEAIDTATGSVRWKVSLAGAVHSPIVVGGVVYLTADGARLVEAIDAATGHERWSFPLDANANCCVAVAKGAVFVATLSGSVYAIAGDGAPIAGKPFPSIAASPSPPPVPDPSAGSTPRPLPALGSVVWTTDLTGRGFAPISQIALDPRTGQIWAPEANADKIAIFNPEDGKLLEEWGGSGSGPGQFDFTRNNNDDGYGTLAFAPDGSFYILDVGNRRIQQFDAQRRFVREWGSFGRGPKQYTDPVGIAVAADGTLYVLDDVRSVVEAYTPAGKVIGSFDPFERSHINNGANALAVDDKGAFYMTGAGPLHVSVFDPSGSLVRFIGDRIFTSQPTQIAIDAAGRMFVTQGDQRGDGTGILVFTTDGALIGGFGPEGTGDGQISFPAGIALDGKGNLYVEDSDPNSARLIKLQLLPPFAP